MVRIPRPWWVFWPRHTLGPQAVWPVLGPMQACAPGVSMGRWGSSARAWLPVPGLLPRLPVVSTGHPAPAAGPAANRTRRSTSLPPPFPLSSFVPFTSPRRTSPHAPAAAAVAARTATHRTAPRHATPRHATPQTPVKIVEVSSASGPQGPTNPEVKGPDPKRREGCAVQCRFPNSLAVHKVCRPVCLHPAASVPASLPADNLEEVSEQGQQPTSLDSLHLNPPLTR